MRLEDTITDILAEATVLSEEGKPDVIENVALSGLESRNGYSYLEKAYLVAEKEKLYENACVFIDHDTKNPRGRSVRDLAGNVINARFNTITKRMMGDIVPLVTESGRFFLELARSRPSNVSMSHVVTGKRNKTKNLVESIQEVLSVDVVTGAATTTSFSEQETDDMSDQALGVLQEQNRALQDENRTARDQHKDLQDQNKELQGQNKVLQEKHDVVLKEHEEKHVSSKAELEELVTKLTEKTAEFDTLKEQHSTLETEMKETKSKLDDFEVKEKLSERTSLIQKELEDAGLSGEVVLTEVFMGQLHEQEDAEKRAGIIEDRKKLIEQSAGSDAVFVAERGSKTSTFNAKEFTEKQDIFVN